MGAKPIEVIMRIDFASSNGTEIVAHACKVSELVRCRDCRYAKRYKEAYLEDIYDCMCPAGLNRQVVSSDYCSEGKRKEVEDE